MALLTTHSATNKVVNSRPVVKYDVTPYYHEYSDGTKKAIYWTLTRTSSWNFSYIGMTEAAAIACAEAVRAEYLLTYLAWDAEVDETTQDEPKVTINPFTEMRCSANIQANHAEGDAWTVDVTVEENDVVVSTKELKTLDEIEAYFQEATDRKIVTGRFKILDAHWSSVSGGIIQADYFADIENFDPANVTAKVKNGDNWVNATIYTYGTKQISIVATTNKTFKFFYGSVESNEFTTHDIEGPTITLESVDLNLNDREPPPAPGQTYINTNLYQAVCDISGGAIYAPYFTIQATGYSLEATTIEALGGNRYNVKALRMKNVPRDLVFGNGEVTVAYNDPKCFGLSNAINFSALRDKFATIVRIDCVGWYIETGTNQKIWRLRVHAKSGYNIKASSARCYPQSYKLDGTTQQHLTTWSDDTEEGSNYVCTIDVRENNSSFAQGIFLKYTVDSVDKYSAAVYMPTDGGPITP